MTQAQVSTKFVKIFDCSDFRYHEYVGVTATKFGSLTDLGNALPLFHLDTKHGIEYDVTIQHSRTFGRLLVDLEDPYRYGRDYFSKN